MEDAYESTLDEVKRAEHLYYVSLKYTRTVDVIRSTMERLINTFDNGFLTVLLFAKQKKKVKEIPPSPILRAKELERLNIYPEMNLPEYLLLYAKLRMLMRLPYTRREEFRRHVTMVVQTEAGPEEINIDIIGEYYQKTFDFLKNLKNLVRP